MRNLIIGLLALALGLGIAAEWRAALADDDCRPFGIGTAVVNIEGPNLVIASGFHVGGGYIVTNAHVLGWESVGQRVMRSHIRAWGGVPWGGWVRNPVCGEHYASEFIAASPCKVPGHIACPWASWLGDVGIVKIAPDDAAKLGVLCFGRGPHRTASLLTHGPPLNVTIDDHLATGWPTYRVRDLPNSAQEPGWFLRWPHHLTARVPSQVFFKGDSGSPVLNERGQVMAVAHSGTMSGDAPSSFTASLSYVIRALLDSHGSRGEYCVQ